MRGYVVLNNYFRIRGNSLVTNGQQGRLWPEGCIRLVPGFAHEALLNTAMLASLYIICDCFRAVTAELSSCV